MLTRGEILNRTAKEDLQIVFSTDHILCGTDYPWLYVKLSDQVSLKLSFYNTFGQNKCLTQTGWTQKTSQSWMIARDLDRSPFIG